MSCFLFCLLASIQLLTINSQLQAAGPYDKYFTPDNAGFTQFDYDAMGIDGSPINEDDSIVTQSSKGNKNAIRKNMGLLAQNVNNFFTNDDKVSLDCPTFPYCNHIPPPLPLMPHPKELEHPLAGVNYGWRGGRQKGEVIPSIVQKLHDSMDGVVLNSPTKGKFDERPPFRPLSEWMKRNKFFRSSFPDLSQHIIGSVDDSAPKDVSIDKVIKSFQTDKDRENQYSNIFDRNDLSLEKVKYHDDFTYISDDLTALNQPKL